MSERADGNRPSWYQNRKALRAQGIDFVQDKLVRRGVGVVFDVALDAHDPDVVMHLAAESHVDRLIDGPGDFVETKITGSYNIPEAARAQWIENGKPAQFRFHIFPLMRDAAR